MLSQKMYNELIDFKEINYINELLNIQVAMCKLYINIKEINVKNGGDFDYHIATTLNSDFRPGDLLQKKYYIDKKKSFISEKNKHEPHSIDYLSTDFIEDNFNSPLSNIKLVEYFKENPVLNIENFEKLNLYCVSAFNISDNFDATFLKNKEKTPYFFLQGLKQPLYIHDQDSYEAAMESINEHNVLFRKKVRNFHLELVSIIMEYASKENYEIILERKKNNDINSDINKIILYNTENNNIVNLLNYFINLNNIGFINILFNKVDNVINKNNVSLMPDIISKNMDRVSPYLGEYRENMSYLEKVLLNNSVNNKETNKFKKRL